MSYWTPLTAHCQVAQLAHPEITYPHLALLVSGGHSMLLLSRAQGQFSLLGGTTDDSLGEAFDKLGTMLGLRQAHGATAGAGAGAGAEECEEYRARVPGKLVGGALVEHLAGLFEADVLGGPLQEGSGAVSPKRLTNRVRRHFRRAESATVSATDASSSASLPEALRLQYARVKTPLIDKPGNPNMSFSGARWLCIIA